VLNEDDGVTIEVQGPAEQLDVFCTVLKNTPPPQARIEGFEIRETTCVDDRHDEFRIRKSQRRSAPKPAVPADLATCRQCVEEIRTSGERRYGYPFTNCTNCGPRWSIIKGLPYDRPQTSMSGFRMCADCRREYDDPTDRRFHAQPIACPRCGPTLRLLDASGHEIAGRDEALQQATRAILSGRIVALQGVGGFQFVVDATNAEAVALLRERKRRPDKPFAVMIRSLEETERRCEVNEPEAQALASPEAPILLIRRRTDRVAARDIAESVAPGNPYLGVMLPYTPFHHLLVDEIARPIVCTSGNLSEEPMAIGTDEAIERLGPIADVFLVHDRPIVRPVDDSVARLGPSGVELIRRARGYAPLPIDLGFEGPTVLAVGGHLKNTVAVALGSQVVVSPHIGDLDNVLSVDVHRRAIRDLIEFFRVVPDVIACDLHPDYASTRTAERLATEWDVPLVRTQHHHSHVAACMAEHRLEGPVLGLSWDGTGYGTDGTVWGGEIIRCHGADFHRVTHLRTFPLPGGDKVAREPRRSALGALFEIFGADAAQHVKEWFTPADLSTLLAILERPGLSPRTSSMGRLFDVVAALCGLPARISFEGQAAMALEFAADWEEKSAYSLLLEGKGPIVADWEGLIRAVLDDRAGNVPIGRISARFHNALAELAVAVAKRANLDRVVLTGGCFQNLLLARRVRERLLEAGFSVYTHGKVPPGDGGISLGQVNIAARRMKETCDVSGNTG
jgi:hydrogenase maturation protein HypF